MTNSDRARRLLQAAEELFAEAKRALRRKSWNLAVRRAQEVVELTLKGLLDLLGGEYPKAHDVAEVFATVARERLPEVGEELLREVIEISADLARKRAPAFYFEEQHEDPDATAAIAQAARVLKLGRRLGKRFLHGDPAAPSTGAVR